MGGFLDMWGLAGPGHPVVLLLLIGVGILAVAHEAGRSTSARERRRSSSARSCSGSRSHMSWVRFAKAIGVYVTAAGAVVMIAGGLLARSAAASRRRRGARPESVRGRVAALLHCAGRPSVARGARRELSGRHDSEARTRRHGPDLQRDRQRLSATSSAARTVQFVLQAIAIYLVVLWLAGAYWAFRDMQHRTENPILPYVAASFVIVFTPIFFPLAIFVYKIIRPHEKIGEVYERNLAEEALLAEVEVDHTTARPAPAASTTSGSSARPAGLGSTGSAPTAAGSVGLDWSLCAWCGKDFERRDLPAAAHDPDRPRSRSLPGRIDETGRIPKTAGGRAHDPQLARSSAGRRPSRCRRRTSCPRADVVGSPVAPRHAHP